VDTNFQSSTFQHAGDAQSKSELLAQKAKLEGEFAKHRAQELEDRARELVAFVDLPFPFDPTELDWQKASHMIQGLPSVEGARALHEEQEQAQATAAHQALALTFTDRTSTRDDFGGDGAGEGSETYEEQCRREHMTAARAAAEMLHRSLTAQEASEAQLRAKREYLFAGCGRHAEEAQVTS
jgi:hypothetical protein